MLGFLSRFDSRFITLMHRWGIPILRVSLGIVFLWFGALKLVGISPVTAIIATAYPLFPTNSFITILGCVEVLIGIGLIAKIFLRVTLLFLWIQMAGTLLSLATAPSLFFFQGNPFLLTVEGEFVIKNLVLIAASIVIAGHDVVPEGKKL
jgi:uncharacterized membrane protein YkgB